MFGLLKNFSVLCLIILNALTSLVNCLEVVYAVNAGGKSHRDIHGILYDQDPLFNKTGTDSDYGKQWMIKRIPEQDHILYQTERYHHSTFGYDIPMKQDGNYVIVLKFCEVYFNSPNMKVFDVMLNQEHHVVSELDIFAKVGRAVAHDEYIQFSVEGGKLMYNNEVSNIKDGRVKIEFIKGYKDNPKINAIAVIKGDLKDIPKLEPIHQIPEEDPNTQEEEEEPASRNKRPSGPKTPDPYSMDDSSLMFPIFIAIGAFIPLLFCLCKI